MMVAYSCSEENFSLYCQRVGALFVVNENGAVKAADREPGETDHPGDVL